MKTKIRPGLLAAIVATLASATLGASYLYVPVPVGSKFDAHITGTLSSSSAGAGQTFGIVAASPMIVGGNVIVTQGAIGQGHVVSARPLGKKPAMITIQLDWILGIDGRRISLSASKPASAGTSNGTNAATPTPVASGSYAGAYGSSNASPAASTTQSGGYAGAYGSAGAGTGAASGANKPLILGQGGPFAKKFPKNKNVEVGPDLVFPAYTSEYTTVTVNM